MGRCVGHMEIRVLFPVIALVLLAAVSGSGPVAQAAPVGPGSIEVQTSNQEQIRFSVEDLSFQWREVPLQEGVLTLFDPGVPGFTTVGDPARPRSPRPSSTPDGRR